MKYRVVLDTHDVEIGTQTLILQSMQILPTFSAYHHGRLVGVCQSYKTAVDILDDWE